jgi:HPt (histidine-containing phosphotransfer) domain-containing protein
VSPTAAIKIAGIDTVRGIEMTGGTLEGYIDVLRLLCSDATNRLALLQNVPLAGIDSETGSALNEFTTQVHALKSALSSIGAANLSQKAALLETAANAEDYNTIGENLDDFRTALSELIDNISNALPAKEIGSQKVDKSALQALRAAIVAHSPHDIEESLEVLGRDSYDGEITQLLSDIADLAFISEFELSLKKVDELVERG